MMTGMSAEKSAKLRVLVADDEQLIANSLLQILQIAGYEVCAVYGGEAALNLLNTYKPDLLITDVMMPDVSGIEVAYAARALLPHCKVILFSGHAALHGLLASGHTRGFELEVIAKPIRPSDLLQKIREALLSQSQTIIVPMDPDESTIH